MYGPQHLYYEDVAVGQSWTSTEREVTSAHIAAFAELSGDRNPIHVDPEYAASTPFGRCIAHGLLTLAIGSGLAIECPPMRTLAVVEMRSIRFAAPVYPGDRLHGTTACVEKRRRGRGKRGEITWERQFLNQDGKVVLDSVSVTLVEARDFPTKD